MEKEYSLSDKELIRNIGDMIVGNAPKAAIIFNDSKVYQLFPEMKDIILYIQQNTFYDISAIKEYIDSINDITIKSIFIASFECWSKT